ncbi:MAG: hypothetical protein LBG81_02665, partial [Coriobacteriaceae bacterium]|nr:hypothetical protein [Coriobacteriaceae bacterium]
MGKDKQEQRGTFRTNQPSVCLVTLGCAKNEVDSTHMSARLRTAGFRLVEAPEDADAVIVNTCSFIEAATEESLEVIFDLMGLKGVKSGKTKVIVAGCMPSRYGHELDRVLPEASAFIPCNREDDVVALLCAVLDITMEDLAADVDIARMTRSDTGSRQGPLSQNGDPSNGDASLGGSDDRD